MEDAIMADLDTELDGRFHPCVQVHEFESLLFVSPDISALSIAMGSSKINEHSLSRKMVKIRDDCGATVEHIDDSPETAPSKRILALVPSYDKVAWGVTAAADVTIPTLRAGCPWLNRWLKRLEAVGST